MTYAPIKRTNVSTLPTSSWQVTLWPLTSRHAKESEIQQRGDVPGHRIMAGKRIIPGEVLFPQKPVGKNIQLLVKKKQRGKRTPGRTQQ